MIDGRDPYTVPLFGPQGDVEKPASVPPADPPATKAPWTPPPPTGTTTAAEKMPWDAPANGGPATAPPPRPAGPTALDEDGNPAMMAHEIKARIHKQLIERLNLSNLDSHDRETVVAEIRRAVQ